MNTTFERRPEGLLGKAEDCHLTIISDLWFHTRYRTAVHPTFTKKKKNTQRVGTRYGNLVFEALSKSLMLCSMSRCTITHVCELAVLHSKLLQPMPPSPSLGY
jgi:hypothetical protein